MADVIEQCAALPQREFHTGEVILEEGKRSGLLYVLASGSVEVLKGDLQVATVDTPGAFFGEVSALLDMPHMATVRALTDATLFVATDSQAFLDAHQEIALSLARLLAKRLHSVTTYLVDLKRQFEDHDNHLSIVDEVLETLVHHQGVESEPGSDRCPDPKVE
ncbi:MAG: cyclic nucleotide-binding domain-containing protein [Deltaproteobacteria bacterium]|nr:cyclic nucleotide-binding domain-containing protein [Deltaproteobacteria bacterium]MBI3386400.1 cyclic nucleotide-binding domain-containing protein [Deltaproteobacteria bacterium]